MKFVQLLQEIRRLQSETDGVYIYGAGFYGKDVYRILHDHGINVQGFLVTDKSGNPDYVLGLPIYEATDFLVNIPPEINRESGAMKPHSPKEWYWSFRLNETA